MGKNPPKVRDHSLSSADFFEYKTFKFHTYNRLIFLRGINLLLEQMKALAVSSYVKLDFNKNLNIPYFFL